MGIRWNAFVKKYLFGKFPNWSLEIKEKGVYFSESCRLKTWNFLKNMLLCLWFYDKFLKFPWIDILPNTFSRTDMLPSTSRRMPLITLSSFLQWGQAWKREVSTSEPKMCYHTALKYSTKSFSVGVICGFSKIFYVSQVTSENTSMNASHSMKIWQGWMEITQQNLRSNVYYLTF